MRIVAVLLLLVPVLAPAGVTQKPSETPALAPGVTTDVLADLRSRLGAMRSNTPLKARVEIRTIRRQGEEGKEKTVERNGSVAVELGQNGLKLSWTPQQIAAARQEAEAREKDDKAPAPNLDSLSLLEAREVAALLDYALPLKLFLEGAELLEQRDDVWQGQPARLLRIRPDFKFNEETRKLLKSHEGELKIWLDPAGLPLAMERHFKLKGSKFFISFTFEEHEVRQLTMAGGRLVVARAEVETISSGMGETGSTKNITSVALITDRP